MRVLQALSAAELKHLLDQRRAGRTIIRQKPLLRQGADARSIAAAAVRSDAGSVHAMSAEDARLAAEVEGLRLLISTGPASGYQNVERKVNKGANSARSVI